MHWFHRKHLAENLNAPVPFLSRRSPITAALRKFYAKSREIYDAALARVRLFLGNSDAEVYHKKVEPHPGNGAWSAARTWTGP